MSNSPFKTIPLTRGQVTLVSSHRYEYFKQWNWCALWSKKSQTFRAARISSRRDGNRHLIFMHREILGLAYGDKRTGDHQNHDTLDNRDDNLRIATKSQQQHNKRKCCTNTSGYKGVSYFSPAKMYRAQITIDGKQKTVGYRKLAEDAARLYDLAALKYHGKFACLNFPREDHLTEQQSGGSDPALSHSC